MPVAGVFLTSHIWFALLFYICQQPIIATTKPVLVIALIGGNPIDHLPKRLVRFGQDVGRAVPTHDIVFSVPKVKGVAHSLNMLIDEFRLEPRNEWILFWNEKVAITPEQIALLLGAKVGVCGALYSNTEEEAQWMAGFYPDLPAQENGLLLVPELDMGAKLYHRTVFDMLEKKHEKLAYIFDQSGRTIFGFCQEKVMPILDYHRMVSPANHLDSLCRETGINIFAHVECIINRAEKEPYRTWEHPRLPPPVCAEELPETSKDPRPITVILQYCDKDKALADTVAKRIWDNSSVEVLLQYSPGNQYPKGPNEAALGTMRLLVKSAAKAVLLIEPDCVPVTADWLEQLSESWDRASAAGKLIMGSWHRINSQHPTLGHINGNLMFDPRLASLVNIPDVPPKIPWDTFLADVFQPHWCRTGLIKNLNRHRTATVAQMTKPECGNRAPVLIHGIRDNSAWDLAATTAK